MARERTEFVTKDREGRWTARWLFYTHVEPGVGKAIFLVKNFR